ncbi:MAG: hypothetical protein AAGA75_25210 [Cyanobacteria bacterium P01_E01_bin.6]
MHLWIVTIGSSDVQLDSDRTCKEKKRTPSEYSEKVWRYWYTDDIKADCNDIDFSPKTLFPYKDETYRISPRILGTVYQAKDQVGQDEIFSYLTFPLLDNFVKELETSPKPEAIAIILTDQSTIFKADQQREKIKSPYWQDTFELKSILRRYFEDRFPKIPCECVELAPSSDEQGLDNWDSVLDLVRQTFDGLTVKSEKIEVASNENVYVSHQAGTPAISSAVQFCSLAKFGDRVKFLVSNEYNQELTDVLPSSNYLIALKQQQAVKLLERHDYSAIKDIYSEYLSTDEIILLEAAIQWNYAKFEEFVNELQHLSDQQLAQEAKERSQKWWWTSYESAYLGLVRMKQENAVEAMFHSFRAVEGLLRQWVDKFYSEEIRQTKHPRWQENERWDKTLNPYGQDLYWFLTLKKAVDQHRDIKQNTTPDIFIFGSQVFKKRNDLFHQLKGLQGKEEVFQNWRSPNEPQWKEDPQSKWNLRVLKCLNFVSGENFEFLDREDADGKVASLMVKVHKELESAIAHL